MDATLPKVDTHEVRQNELLSVLLAGIGDRIAGHILRVDLPAGAILHPAQNADACALFPNDALISVLSVIESGQAAEIGIVGSEGVVGLEGLIGWRNPYLHAKVQCAGTAFRVPMRLLREAFNCRDDMRWQILRYMQSMIAQMGQAVICNRYHSIEQQLCRKLLMSSDRLGGNRLALTQSTIAELLGVRREGVTAAAGELRRLGVIDYSRGKIVILDRAELDARSCECYAIIKAQCDRHWPAGSVLTGRSHEPPSRVTLGHPHRCADPTRVASSW